MERESSELVSRIIRSYGQDLIYGTSKGRVKTIKSVVLQPCDRINYSRYMTVFISGMDLLPREHPEVYEEFIKMSWISVLRTPLTKTQKRQVCFLDSVLTSEQQIDGQMDFDHF